MVYSLKKKLEQERLYLNEGSGLKPLRRKRSSTAQLQKNREKLGSDGGVIG